MDSVPTVRSHDGLWKGASMRCAQVDNTGSVVVEPRRGLGPD